MSYVYQFLGWILEGIDWVVFHTRAKTLNAVVIVIPISAQNASNCRFKSAKTKRKIVRLHHYIADSRRDFLHKTSTKIAKNHSIVYVEDLKVSNMSASAGGTKESPGKNVRQKSGLNRSILDQGWYSFFQTLSYKLERGGGKLIKIDPRNTSRTCPR